MSEQLWPNVDVTITVSVGDETEKFTATGNSTGDPWRLAGKLVDAVAGDARHWSVDRGIAADKEQRRADA